MEQVEGAPTPQLRPAEEYRTIIGQLYDRIVKDCEEKDAPELARIASAIGEVARDVRAGKYAG